MSESRRSDLYLSAFLVTKGIKLKGLVEEGGRKLFVFDAPEEEVQKLEIAYSNRNSEESKVSALDFADNIRSMKRLCYKGM